MFFKKESNNKTTAPNSPSTVTQGSPSSSPIPIISKKPKNTPEENIAYTSTGFNLSNGKSNGTNSFLLEMTLPPKKVTTCEHDIEDDIVDPTGSDNDDEVFGGRMSY